MNPISAISDLTTRRIRTAHVASAANLDTVDAVRAICALLIVWIHVPRSAGMVSTIIVARFAVPFFVVSAIFFAVTSALQNPQRGFVEYSIARLRRIYVPFLAWSGIYLALKLGKLILAPQQPNEFPGWIGLLVGTAYHLWFLPFICIASILAFGIAKWTRTNKTTHPCLLWIVISLGVSIAAVDATHWNVHDGVKYMWASLPSVCGAFIIAVVHFQRPSESQPFVNPLLVVGVLAIFFLVMDGRNTILETLAGTMFFVAALQAKQSGIPRFLKSLAPLSFGIYLSHLLFIKIFEAVVDKFHIEPSAWFDLGIFSGTIVCSIGLTWWMQKSPRLRWLAC